MIAPRIQAKGIWFSYPDNGWALQGADLTVEPGEFLAIIGQNGSGKSTVAKHFNALLRPERGLVLHDGTSIANQSVGELARRVGYVFQNPDHQLFQPTVEEELALGPRYLGYAAPEVRDRIENTLEQFGLGEWRAREIGSLDFGGRRMLSVAAALITRPAVIVLDEPTTGLHWGAAELLMDRIGELHSEGHSIVLITHDMRLVVHYATRIALMIGGRIEATGAPQKLFADIELLERAHIRPPQVVQLIQRLQLSPNGLTVQAVCDTMRAMEGQLGG
jgi:energy-coupling factor transport system ATP-binding protein